MITDTTARALQLIRDHKIDSPSQFALLMWPDNPNWKKSGRAGPNGSAKGIGMRLAGGAYLGKLNRRGLIKHSISLRLPYRLTDEGKSLLSHWESRP